MHQDNQHYKTSLRLLRNPDNLGVANGVRSEKYPQVIVTRMIMKTRLFQTQSIKPFAQFRQEELKFAENRKGIVDLSYDTIIYWP